MFQIKTGFFLLLVSFSFLWYFEKFTNEIIAQKVQWCITLFLMLFVLISIVKQQRELYILWQQKNNIFNMPKTQLLDLLQMPIVIFNNKKDILWYNSSFKTELAGNMDIIGENIALYIPQLTSVEFKKNSKVTIQYNDKEYLIFTKEFIKTEQQSETLTFLCMLDITEHTKLLNTYQSEKVILSVVVIDNYEAMLQQAGELERVKIESTLEYTVKTFFEEVNGIVQKIDKDKFLAIFSNEQLNKLCDEKFLKLEKMKNTELEIDVMPTISMGISNPDTKLLKDKLKEAYKSLDMALGRGGDQVALKTKDGYSFFGNMAADVEQRTSVKARIVALAFSNLIENSSSVIVMGHKFADLDCFGAAVGIAKIARSFNKPVKIAINQTTHMVGSLLTTFIKDEEYKDIITDFSGASSFIKQNTLVVVVDLHTMDLVEYPELLKMTKNIVVIDHHRKMVNHIDNALLFYHEPFASSASEMVTEIIRYLSEKVKLNKLEAMALLSGLVLDTKNFVFKTRTRTFQSAALLRDCGADTIAIRKMFANTAEEYKQINDIVSKAALFNNCAICVAYGESIEARLIIAKAADSLMNIKGVDASFVIYENTEGCLISARSFGKINVQIIMEALGGGGHRIMAAAQVKGKSSEEVVYMLKSALNKTLN